MLSKFKSKIKSWLYPTTKDYRKAIKKAHIKFESDLRFGRQYPHQLIIQLYHNKRSLSNSSEGLVTFRTSLDNDINDYLLLIDKISDSLKNSEYTYVLHKFGGTTIKEK